MYFILMKNETDWQNLNEGSVMIFILPDLKDKGIHQYSPLHSKRNRTPFLRLKNAING